MPLFGRSPGPVPTAPAEHAPYDPSPIAEGEDECAGWDADLETLRERLNEATTTMGQQINTLQWSGHTSAPPLDDWNSKWEPKSPAAAGRSWLSRTSAGTKSWNRPSPLQPILSRSADRLPKAARPVLTRAMVAAFWRGEFCPRRLPVVLFLGVCAIASLANSATFLTTLRTRDWRVSTGNRSGAYKRQEEMIGIGGLHGLDDGVWIGDTVADDDEAGGSSLKSSSSSANAKANGSKPSDDYSDNPLSDPALDGLAAGAQASLLGAAELAAAAAASAGDEDEEDEEDGAWKEDVTNSSPFGIAGGQKAARNASAPSSSASSAKPNATANSPVRKPAGGGMVWGKRGGSAGGKGVGAAPPPFELAAPPSPASCTPSNKFDFDVEACDGGCQQKAKKFHCTMCKCKGCKWCDAAAAAAPANATTKDKPPSPTKAPPAGKGDGKGAGAATGKAAGAGAKAAAAPAGKANGTAVAGKGAGGKGAGGKPAASQPAAAGKGKGAGKRVR